MGKSNENFGQPPFKDSLNSSQNFLSKQKQLVLKLINKPSKVLLFTLLVIILAATSYFSISVLNGNFTFISSKSNNQVKQFNRLSNIYLKSISSKSSYTTSKFIPVLSVSFNKTSITLKEGETATLTSTVNPSNATEPAITFISNNPSVATVDDKGIVRAVGEGTALIKTNSIKFESVTCKIIVNSNQPLLKKLSNTISTVSYPIYTNSGTIIYSQYGDKEGTLSIPNVNINNIPILHGDGDEQLSKGIGQFIGGCYPGEKGKVILAGHNYLAFRNLQYIKNGDEVSLNLVYGKYKYQVYKTEIVSENNTYIIQPDKSHEYLIMYTCYPFNSGTYHHQRFVVYANLIEGTKGFLK